MNPFHTLFNITKSVGDKTNVDHIPEGVRPLCDTTEDVTVDARYHEEDEILTKPQTAITQQIKRDIGDTSQPRVFAFSLSEKAGALLVLPRGGVLRKLEKVDEFRRRIRQYWRQWYEFAEREADLDDSQTLCLLTGIERCSSWAMAVWDSGPGHARNVSDSLHLTVDDDSGACRWSFRPARCWTQSSPTRAVLNGEDPKETIFVRGFWIHRYNDSTSTSPSPPPPSPPPNVDGNGGPSGSRSRNSFNRSRRTDNSSRNPSSQCCGSSSNSSPPTQRNSFERSHSGTPSSEHDQLNGACIINLPTAAFDTVDLHPCHLISKVAFELASEAHSSLLGSNYISFSHDEDWMSVLEDGDAGFPNGIELIRRICKRFKFVVERGVIYTERMTSGELEHCQRILDLAETETELIPVLSHQRSDDDTHFASVSTQQTSNPQDTLSKPRSRLDAEETRARSVDGRDAKTTTYRKSDRSVTLSGTISTTLEGVYRLWPNLRPVSTNFEPLLQDGQPGILFPGLEQETEPVPEPEPEPSNVRVKFLRDNLANKDEYFSELSGLALDIDTNIRQIEGMDPQVKESVAEAACDAVFAAIQNVYSTSQQEPSEPQSARLVRLEGLKQ
ncbi:hypothetical protein PQX77_000590 [Marasmius sp. AFHP31]|nr:hypothetical protein PQX77_000590 [Marasmius sp. AFHP31]